MKHQWVKDGYYCRPRFGVIGTFIVSFFEALGMLLIVWAVVLLFGAIFGPPNYFAGVLQR